MLVKKEEEKKKNGEEFRTCIIHSAPHPQEVLLLPLLNGVGISLCTDQFDLKLLGN